MPDLNWGAAPSVSYFLPLASSLSGTDRDYEVSADGQWPMKARDLVVLHLK